MSFQKIKECLDHIQKITNFKPCMGIVLGSGLGDFANKIDVAVAVCYTDIKGFPVSTVSGHEGRFVFGHLNGVPIVIMQGRVHYYEGYDMDDIVLPVRLMGLMGAKTIILTNAAGGINETFAPGDFMIIRDHISSFVPSPLTGRNIEELGVRFPDMSAVYSRGLQKIISFAAEDLGINIKRGVYVQAPGPNFETPAEINMYKLLGADAVGMSTACEAIAAVHMGMDVCGISCISNFAAGMSGVPLTHEDVKKTADMVAAQFKELISKVVCGMYEAT